MDRAHRFANPEIPPHEIVEACSDQADQPDRPLRSNSFARAEGVVQRQHFKALDVDPGQLMLRLCHRERSPDIVQGSDDSSRTVLFQ